MCTIDGTLRQGFSEKDIYVCESRYTCKIRTFKKIKHWSVPRNASVKVVARAEPLTPVRVASVFAEQRSASPAPSLDVAGVDDSDVLDKARQVVEQVAPQQVAAGGDGEASASGCRYYEQLQSLAGWFKIGEYLWTILRQATSISACTSLWM